MEGVKCPTMIKASQVYKSPGSRDDLPVEISYISDPPKPESLAYWLQVDLD